MPSPFNLSTLDGENGAILDGALASSNNGYGSQVALLGDINGDGIDDLAVGAPQADSVSLDEGRASIVFGRKGNWPSPLPLSTLDGSNGFTVDGEAAIDYLGSSISSAGDINGDGFDDLIIGASGTDPNGSYSGGAYVILGSDSPWLATFDLSTLNGSNGFRIDGEAADDFAGRAVNGAGDINGDGFDDLIIGAELATGKYFNTGRSYIIFGSNAGFPSALALGDLDGFNGFTLWGEAEDDYSGRSIGPAGDFNGDGIDDFIVGAPSASNNGLGTGRSYVIFGRTDRVFRDRFEQ